MSETEKYEYEYDKWAWDGRAKLVQVPLLPTHPVQFVLIDTVPGAGSFDGEASIFLRTTRNDGSNNYVYLSLDDAENLATLMLYLVNELKQPENLEF